MDKIYLLSILFSDRRESYWVGASDIGKKAGDFYWRDGTKFGDSLWEENNPNDFKEGQITCITLYSKDRLFFDSKCTDDNSFIPVCHLGKI